MLVSARAERACMFVVAIEMARVLGGSLEAAASAGVAGTGVSIPECAISSAGGAGCCSAMI